MKLLLLSILMSVAFTSTGYVNIEVKPSVLHLSTDRRGHFEIRLIASNGIHVNAQPPLAIKSLSDSVKFTLADVPSTGDYVDLSKPIKVVCEAQGLGTGKTRAEFVLNYTYCSDKEGWCRMGKDTTSLEINIRK